jgi:FeS assembly SUF system protein
VTTNATTLEQRVIDALRTVHDPEIPVNIYDLGLVYRCDVDEHGVVEVDMTLTAPGCPVAQTFPATVEATIRQVPGVSAARVELVWDPPWCQDRMSDAAKLELGLL